MDTNIPARLPNCKAEYEVHFLESGDTQHAPSNTWVGDDGALITGKYGEDFRINDFCVDLDVETQGLVAVTCDACKEKVYFVVLNRNAHFTISDTMCKLVLPPWLRLHPQP